MKDNLEMAFKLVLLGSIGLLALVLFIVVVASVWAIVVFTTATIFKVLLGFFPALWG